MVTGRSSITGSLPRLVISACCIFLLHSCATIVKNYPPGKPFVYQTNIHITGNIPSDTAEEMISRLKGQLDDSMRARSVSKVLWSVMKNPPAYDVSSAEKSVTYMRALLNSMGYFRDTITYDTIVSRTRGDQYRTTVNFRVTPGKVVRIDSFRYNIRQAELQQLATSTQQASFVKKGDPFAKTSISNELDRLVEMYRNNGYMRFGRDELIGLWDTLDVSLLRPTFDPLEQLEILQKLKERRENPTANLEIRLKPGFDSSKLTKYYIGTISVYPDFGPDTLGYTRRETVIDGIRIISYKNLFRHRILPPNIFFRRGSLYQQQLYYKTINRFNALGAWGKVNIEPVPRKNQDTADLVIHLTPASKYSFTANIEGSRNTNVIAGNLFGVGLNLSLQNRNFAKAANVSNSTLRYGVEVSTDSNFIQTQQFVFSHTIAFPRPVPNVGWIPQRIRENFRTLFSFNAGNTERKDLFNLSTVNGSWGYEFQNRNALYYLRLPNIEYSYLVPRKKLNDLFITNPSLRNIFTDGLISSIIAGVTFRNSTEKVQKIFRFNTEISGMVAGLFRSSFLDDNLYRFIKADAEIIRKMTLSKNSSLVLRLFTGIGYELNSTVNPQKRNNLPFFKQYFAGGPNSMRAWGLRKLGKGTSGRGFTGAGSTPERYGDMQIEGNIEYRFPLFKPFGIPIEGALFSDIGNIWLLKEAADTLGSKEVFRLRRLGEDLAVGIGTGFRINFGFFVVRLDYSYKAKDPSPDPAFGAYQNKWFAYPLFKGDQFQLGISYPFIL